MIHEYALEPGLVATWVDKPTAALIRQSFGVGRGRLVSRFPKAWAKRVYEELQGATPIERKLVEEILVLLTEKTVTRNQGHFDPERGDWLDNALVEHEVRPFHAILARANPAPRSGVLTQDDLYGGHELWSVDHGRCVPRNATCLSKAVAPFLRVSSEIVFVDPHFQPDRKRYRNTLAAYLRETMRSRPGGPPKLIELVAKDGYDKPSTEWFRQQCQEELPQCVPLGTTITVRRLAERDDGERLHSRYVLSDLGGIAFHTGLDEEEERSGPSEDLTLLSRKQYRDRWSQYKSNRPSAFDQNEPAFSITGSRPLDRG